MPTQLGLSGCNGKQTNRWDSQTTQPSHLIVGYRRLNTVKPTDGFIRLYTVKPSHYWVYQAKYPSQHSQLGLSDYPANGYSPSQTQQDTTKPTDGFIRLPSKPSFLLVLSGYQQSHLSYWVYQVSKEMGRKNC